jgi:hypothetical protein
MYIFFRPTLTDFERPVNTSLEDSIHMPQNYNNRDSRQAPNSRNSSPPADTISETPETPKPETWEEAIHAYSWDVPRYVRQGRNRPTFTLDDGVERGYSTRDGALTLEREDQTELMRRLRREKAFLRSRGRGSERTSAVSALQMQGPDPVYQVPVAASRGLRSLAFNKPCDTHLPILQRLRDIRADSQDEVYAAVSKSKSNTENRQARVDDVSDREELIKAQPKEIEVQKSETAIPSPPPTPESIPDMEARLSDSDWVKPSIVNPPPYVLTEEEAAKEYDEIASKAPEWCTIKLRNFNDLSRELPDNRVMAPDGKATVVHAQARKSSESVSSDSSEEDDSMCYSSDNSFEVLEMPKIDESEHNRAKRKWYKGYRR